MLLKCPLVTNLRLIVLHRPRLLLCLGKEPRITFRQFSEFLSHNERTIVFAEPQTKMAPKLKDSKIELKREIFPENSTVALMCVAQSSPIPVFRYYHAPICQYLGNFESLNMFYL
jgi:hypothetical protein